MRSSNPALGENTFDVFAAEGEATMTIQGTVIKTFILTVIVFATATWAWVTFAPTLTVEPTGRLKDVHVTGTSATVLIASALGAFVVGLITIFNQRQAALFAPLYAALEGVSLGIFSAAFEGVFRGIVIQAVGLTTGTLLALLLLYITGLIKPSENFKLGVVAATGGIALTYLASIILGLFGVPIPFIHDTGVIGICFSLFVVTIAALNLVLDFDFIEQGAERKAPKYLEWYASFGLLVTLVWLYIEFVKLLAELRSKD